MHALVEFKLKSNRYFILLTLQVVLLQFLSLNYYFSYFCSFYLFHFLKKNLFIFIRNKSISRINDSCFPPTYDIQWANFNMVNHRSYCQNYYYSIVKSYTLIIILIFLMRDDECFLFFLHFEQIFINDSIETDLCRKSLLRQKY